MKKSRSSVPRFAERWPPGPAPPVRKDGLLATAGRPEPEPPVPAEGLLVAMAVGNTNEGESLPAKPGYGELGQSMIIGNLGMPGVANLAWRTPCRWLGDVSDGGPGSCCLRSGRGGDGTTWKHVLVHDNGGGCVGHCCGGLLLRAARDDCSLVRAQSNDGQLVSW